MNFSAILDAVVSHAMTTGLFDSVNTSEPKSAPGNGITAAIWVQRVAPVATASGLDSTSGVIELTIRLYNDFIEEPSDQIDPNLMDATDQLFTLYSGDFTLGGAIKNVDLLGTFGEGLSGRAGYLTIDNKMFRVFDINLPLVVNDLWSQSA